MDVGAVDPMASLAAAGGVAQVAAAAAAAAKAEKLANKPKIAFEVRPFTKESLEKINLRTSNLIRDYGFLPKRKPNLLDGAELPAKYEPFPPELLGKPIEEIDQYVYEKVRFLRFLWKHLKDRSWNFRFTLVNKVFLVS